MSSTVVEQKKNPWSTRWFLLVLAVSFGFLYLSLFSLAWTPIFRTGDECGFWTYACRMLAGDVLLRDFHQFFAPGTDLVYFTAFRLFGVSIRTINWIILCLGMVLGVVCFFNARAILRANLAALAALSCVVLLYGDRMDATHHWFSSLANLLAILVLMHGGSKRRIAGAACLIGIALFFTQSGGFMGMLACCAGLWWEKRVAGRSSAPLGSRLAAFLCVTSGVWLVLNWRFIALAGLANYWNMEVLYLPKDVNFPTGFLIPHFTWAFYPHAIAQLADRLATYILFLLVCPTVMILCTRGKVVARESSVPLVYLASLGILQAIEVIFMLNWNRMAAVSMPAVVLFVWLISQWSAARRLALIGCWCVLGAMIVLQSAVMQLHHYPRINLPTGSAMFQQDEAEKVGWLVRHTHPGDYFLEVATMRFYAPLALRNPSPVDLLSTAGFTLPEWVDEVLAGLKTHPVRYVLWEPYTGLGTVEERHRSATDHLDPLREYLQENFTRTATFANGGEIWERVKPR
jgi:hypothetical protein